MACYHPIKAWKSPFLKGRTVFSQPVGDLSHWKEFHVPCGQCIGCRLKRSREWALRLVHEKRFYKESVFLTLTYNEENLPVNRTLVLSDLQLFIKRLRWYLDNPTIPKEHRRKIRYFACGEYGDATSRPHYHVIVFGWQPSDGVIYRKSARHDGLLWTSELVESIWNKGYCPYGEVTYESCAYVARYVVKKLTGIEGEIAYDLTKRKPPFIVMSRRPGIGSDWYEQYKKEVWDNDSIVTPKGVETSVPRYYYKQLEKSDPRLALEIKAERMKELEKFDIDFERLAVSEKIHSMKQHKEFIRDVIC